MFQAQELYFMIYLHYCVLTLSIPTDRPVGSLFGIPKILDTFTGCQVPHFMIVLIPYIILLNLFDNKMPIFEECGTFNLKRNINTRA